MKGLWKETTPRWCKDNKRKKQNRKHSIKDADWHLKKYWKKPESKLILNEYTNVKIVKEKRKRYSHKEIAILYGKKILLPYQHIKKDKYYSNHRVPVNIYSDEEMILYKRGIYNSSYAQKMERLCREYEDIDDNFIENDNYHWIEYADTSKLTKKLCT